MLMKEINDAVVNSRLDEDFVDIEKKMQIMDIIEKEGEISDNAQLTTLAIMLSLARDGKLEGVSNFNEASPEGDIVELLKITTPETVLKLAVNVLDVLDMKDAANRDGDFNSGNDIIDILTKNIKAQE